MKAQFQYLDSKPSKTWFSHLFSQIGSIYFFLVWKTNVATESFIRGWLRSKQMATGSDYFGTWWPPSSAAPRSRSPGPRKPIFCTVATVLFCFISIRSLVCWFVGLLHFPTITSNFKIENLHFYLKQDSFKITLAAESILKNIDMLLIF